MKNEPTNILPMAPWCLGLETDDIQAQIISADGQHIAMVSADPLRPTANLIIAAPALFDALQGVANDSICMNGFHEQFRYQIRAALAKARGMGQ